MKGTHKLLEPETYLVVSAFILITQSITATHCHAIDSSETVIQEISHSRLTPEHLQNQTKPHFRWLNAKTAAVSETQLDQPPVREQSSASPSNFKPNHEASLLNHHTNQLESTTSAPITTASTTTLPSSTSSEAQTTRLATTTKSTTVNPRGAGAGWLEGFLTNAERLSFDEQHQREQISNTVLKQHVETKVSGEDLVDSATLSEYLSSQAPTDSEEDPLEAPVTTIVTGDDLTQELHISTDGSGNDDGQTKDQTSLLIESNNVSAVLAINENEEAEKQNAIVTLATKQILSCDQAYNQCGLRRVCAQALRVYDEECRGLISNWTNQCSARCLRAMIALRSSEEGDNLVNCDCQNNEYCLQNKIRSSICRPEVEKAIQPKSIVSCSTASAICMADQLCSTAFDYYYHNCQTLFSQRHCSMRCNNSLAILYRQPKASKLIDCRCDGSEEFPCVRYKTYTERLCLNKHHTMMDDDEDNPDGLGGTNFVVGNAIGSRVALAASTASNWQPVLLCIHEIGIILVVILMVLLLVLYKCPFQPS